MIENGEDSMNILQKILKIISNLHARHDLEDFKQELFQTVFHDLTDTYSLQEIKRIAQSEMMIKYDQLEQNMPFLNQSLRVSWIK